ncbi:tetratricopeptide repeat protein [Nocardiopsis dassonvillei]|uniref:tetratricopeptide repeat protein n=1 Tax=Nocardiopsis dassonvillei TaxID=2014 RepID=UPI0033D2E1B5
MADLEALLTELAPAPEDGDNASAWKSEDSSSGVVVSALAGMGGVGKTALALAAGAIAHYKEWFCAHLYVDLRGYTPGTEQLSAEAALDVLLRQMGVDPQDIPPEVAERSAFYRSALTKLSQADERHRPVLVVADNARSTAQVRPLLPGPGRHRLVATTRGGLHSLTGARHLDLDVLDPEGSLALLTFALTTNDPKDPRVADQEALRRLAWLCGHLPLALEIAAAQLARKPRLSPGRLAERLEQATSRVDKLKDPGPDAERSRALRAVFDTSLDQLSPQEVRVFLLVASAPGPTTSTTSSAVLTGFPEDEVEETLEELEAAHLLTQPAPGRWGAHDLLADHATTHPRPPEDRDHATARLLDHYTVTAGAADVRLGTLPRNLIPDRFPDQKTALAWLDAERTTLVTAALAAPAIGHIEAAIGLPLHLASYLNRGRHFEDMAQVSLCAQKTAHANKNHFSEGLAWNNLGLALRAMRRFDDAIDAIKNAHVLFRKINNTLGEAQALNNLGLTLLDMRQIEDAIKFLREAELAFRQTNSIHERAQALNNLGTALRQSGKAKEAIEALARAGKMYSQVEDAYGHAAALNNLGSALRDACRFREAIDTLKQADSAFRQANDIHGQAQAWGNIGATLQQLGQFDEAAEAFIRSRNLFHRAKDFHREALAWSGLGIAFMSAGKKARAVDSMRQAIALFEATGDKLGGEFQRAILSHIQQG